MNNIYETPGSDLNAHSNHENNSGLGQNTFPEGVAGWSWGAFLLSWIWAIGNKSWIGLLALVPYIGFLFSIYLGIKGRELAWKNKKWESVEHFNRVQRSWSKWGLILIVTVMIAGVLAAIIIPAYQEYALRSQGL